MKTRIKLVLFMILTGSNICPTVCAQQTLTLNECIERAVKNNIRIKNAQNEVSMAKHTSQEAFTK